jgi:hypothetical protein
MTGKHVPHIRASSKSAFRGKENGKMDPALVSVYCQLPPVFCGEGPGPGSDNRRFAVGVGVA